MGPQLHGSGDSEGNQRSVSGLDDTKLNILHDHYKDSFTSIRERERQRDILFLIVIALLGFVVFQVTYASLSGVLSEIDAGAATLDLTKVPEAAILSTTWTFLLALMLRYCQVSVHVEKQY